MNINQQDIDDSISYLLNLINNRSLDLDHDNIELFINFVYQEGYTESFNGKLLQYFQNKSKEELNELADEFRLHEEFNALMIYSFHIGNRNELKRDLIEIEQEGEADELITAAFELQNRREQKQLLVNLEKKPYKSKFRFLYFISGIAASITLVLFIFLQQISSSSSEIATSEMPATQENTTEVYSTDKSFSAEPTVEKSSIRVHNKLAYADISLTRSELKFSGDNFRGDEFYIENYTQEDTPILFEAIEAVKNENYNQAIDIFKQFEINIDKNPELSLFLSIAQFNTNEVNVAIQNLEYLKKLDSFAYKDEAKLNLAFAYLKNEELNKAIPILKELKNSNKGKIAEIAFITLNELDK